MCRILESLHDHEGTDELELFRLWVLSGRSVWGVGEDEASLNSHRILRITA